MSGKYSSRYAARKSIKDKTVSSRRYSNNNNTPAASPRWLKGQLGTLRAKRTYIAQTGWSSSNVAVVGTSLYFRLSNLPNYTEFTNLFDKYRIMKVRVTFIPKSQQAGTDVATARTGTVAVAIDYDSAVSPAALGTVMEYDNCKLYTGEKRITRTFKPRIATAVYNGAFTGYAEGMKDMWIDNASPDVQYYGLIAAMDVTPALASQQYDIYVDMWMDFCNLN